MRYDMEKYINGAGKECYRSVGRGSPFQGELFHKPEYQFDTDESFALHTNLGSLTVLDRLTGFIGYVRDIETGFRDREGNFWLASGGQDVRESGVETIGEAIDWIKARANTCTGNNKPPLSNEV
jgi:hypothetical protein